MPDKTTLVIDYLNTRTEFHAYKAPATDAIHIDRNKNDVVGWLWLETSHVGYTPFGPGLILYAKVRESADWNHMFSLPDIADPRYFDELLKLLRS